MNDEKQVWRYQIGWPEKYPPAKPVEPHETFSEVMAHWQLAGFGIAQTQNPHPYHGSYASLGRRSILDELCGGLGNTLGILGRGFGL